jgi:UPF0755 protein
MLNRYRTSIVAVLVAGLVLAGVGTWMIFGGNTPHYDGERSVKIPPGANFSAVADSLEQRGILSSRTTFRFVGWLSGWRHQVKTGHYTFEAGASNYRMLNVLRRGLQTPIRVTIPPGSRPEVVSAVAGRDMAFSSEGFHAALRDTALAAALDTDTTSLFGYMMPETYFFYWQTPARDVVRRIKEQFDTFYAENLQSRADSLDLSQQELVTLASIIEWETGIVDEKPRIAGVYLNRLDRGMPLQADPTVQYAVMEREGQKRRLLFADYDIDHPFNTYNYRGLPPGPLTNPSPSSMRAVVDAEDHQYFYFVATGDGGHTFSQTYREHVRAANEYRRLMRERRRNQNASDNG